MTNKGRLTRTIYMRVTENEKRKYVAIGVISKKGRVKIFKGMPNPGWFE